MTLPLTPGIGLALGGGAVRSVAHLGVLEVFESAGIPIKAIAGTSGGSLIGALYASRKYRIEQLIDQVLDLRWWDMVRPALSKQGLLDSKAIARFLVRKLGPISFSDLPVRFVAVACDLHSGQKVILHEGPLAPSVQASCSLPVVFTPTVLNGQRLVDGGYVSQIPIRAVRGVLTSEKVIGVDVNYRAIETVKPPDNIFLIAIHLASMWARRNADEESQYADAMIQVDVRGIGLTNLRKAEDLIERGRKAAQESLKQLR
jgi:NTE family protein